MARMSLVELLANQFPGVDPKDIFIEVRTVEKEEAELNLLNVLMKMLRFEEGYRLTEYLDSKGIPSIGIGHQILPEDRKKFPTVNGKLTIAPAQAEALFTSDIQTALTGAKNWIGSSWAKLSVNRQAVCAGMVYQMGFASVLDFKETREHILLGHWGDVKAHILGSKRIRDTPKRLMRMANIMVTDVLPSAYK